MSCQNNLKQLGMAIHSFKDANQHFPPGTMPNPELPPEQRLSFLLAILPWLESQSLYSAVAKTEAWDSPKNVHAMAADGSVYGNLYQCPEWMNLHSYRDQRAGRDRAPIHHELHRRRGRGR